MTVGKRWKMKMKMWWRLVGLAGGGGGRRRKRSTVASARGTSGRGMVGGMGKNACVASRVVSSHPSKALGASASRTN